MFARFTTVAGERGAADAERDIRGFALKFYTEEGNWDMVGNNTPVFFLRDPLKFPDLNNAVKRDPRTNMRSPRNNWDFWTLLPEACTSHHRDERPRHSASYRHMHGFGSHTLQLHQCRQRALLGQIPLPHPAGHQEPDRCRSEALIGKDRESHQRDLYEAIERGDFPKWTMYVQIMPEAEAEKVPYHPFDLTKVWPKGDYPLIEVGEFELNRNPENFYADVEQAAFNPAATSCPASASRRTRCCRRACSTTPTRSATGWASTTTRFRSTPRAARCTATTATAPCASTATTADAALRAQQLWPVAGAARLPRAAAEDPSVTPTTGIIATTPTTTRSRASCSA
jgi:hypothetical protein